MVFAIRIGLIAGVATLLVLSGLSMLSGNAVKQGLQELEIARYRYLVSSLKATVEANLGLGLPIQDLPALQSKIERDRSAEANVRAIEIVGPNDTALYSTDRGAIGDRIPSTWRRAINDHHHSTWVAYDRGEVAIGEAIENDFAQVIGHVVLVIAEDQVIPPRDLTFALASKNWATVLIGSLLAGLSAMLVFSSRGRAIARAAAVWQGAWTPQRALAKSPKPEPLGPSLETASRNARNTSEQAAEALDRAKRRLMEIDDAV